MKAAVAAAVMLVSPFSAHAVTLTNNHKAEVEATFDKGAQEIKHKIAPGASITEPCDTGCGVRVGGHDVMATTGLKLVTDDGYHVKLAQTQNMGARANPGVLPR